MASEFSIRAINDWRAEIHTDMARAQRVSMDVFRRDSPNALRHLLILMAQSARALTPQAKKRRKVLNDAHGPYVNIIGQNGHESKRYKWMFSRPEARGTWEGAQTIRGRGLAKRSWMWGLQAAGKGNPIPGTGEVRKVSAGTRMVGWVKINALSYIGKIMPAGYQRMAEQKAVNKLMKQAEMKLVRAFERKVGRR